MPSFPAIALVYGHVQDEKNDVIRGITVAGCKTRRNNCVNGLVIEHFRELSSLKYGINGASPVENNLVL